MLKNILFLFLIVSTFSCKSDQSPNKSVSSGVPEIDEVSERIAKDDSNPLLYFERAQKYYAHRSFDNTILDIQRAMKYDSLNPDFYHLLSDAYLDYFNSKEAVNAMLRVLSIYPERVPSLLKLAELKYILEDYDSSILTINEVIRIDPQNADSYFTLGLNFRALGDTDRAINSFQTAVEMNSKMTDAWLILGELYEKKKDIKALQYYESAIISDPSSMLALHSKAFYLQNHNDINGAQEIYRKIINTDKSYEDAFLNSGILYLETDSIQRAFEQFDILAGIAPTNYLGFYMRGVTYEKMNKKQEALKDYESAYNLNKEDKRVSASIERLKKSN